MGDRDRSSNANTERATIPFELSKRLMARQCSGFRIPNETAVAVSEVLRLFVVEARARASIEAECDLEGDLEEFEDGKKSADQVVTIRADHITKIAAELLMDFS